ncbi:MAG: beta-ketoacyl-ACP synthase II [Anaerolineae bacterium]|nr:beta-ketoacyl-ACP synthase II [Anaerolineales bacterium]MCQ3975494.1 beta-ketoacyl-[acyl-carrier-protein] synthase II [Anaerolineae bacterium]
MYTNGNGNRRRVVVTGMGAVSPLGNTLAATWAAMMQGECAVDTITKFDTAGFPCTMAAFVRDFDPTQYMDKRDARRMAPFLHFAVAAAQEALANAGLDLNQEDPTRVGVEIGSAIGGADVVEEERLTLEREGVKKVNPAAIPALLINMPGCFIAIHHNIRGPVNASVTACATGISGIGEGMRRIVWGDADTMLVGGTESAITPLTISAFGRLTALSKRNDTPKRAITPFDANRDGTIVGEGAGVLVLESLEHAQARGARILAEVKGYSLTSDAFHISSPREDGSSQARAMRQALKDGGLEPHQVNYIGAHGTGTPMNDAIETIAIKTAFGESAYDIAISSIKSMTGHTLGAAGALSAIAAIKAMHEGFIPPTINLETPDPSCDLDYVPNQPRRAEVKVAVVNGFGFGGQNASIALQKWEE